MISNNQATHCCRLTSVISTLMFVSLIQKYQLNSNVSMCLSAFTLTPYMWSLMLWMQPKSNATFRPLATPWTQGWTSARFSVDFVGWIILFRTNFQRYFFFTECTMCLYECHDMCKYDRSWMCVYMFEYTVMMYYASMCLCVHVCVYKWCTCLCTGNCCAAWMCEYVSKSGLKVCVTKSDPDTQR